MGGSDPTFFKDAKFQVKNFSLYQVLCFSQGGGGGQTQLFSRMPNFKSKMFPFTKRSGLVFLRWGDAMMQILGSEEIGSFGNYSLTRGGQCLVQNCPADGLGNTQLWTLVNVLLVSAI